MYSRLKLLVFKHYAGQKQNHVTPYGVISPATIRSIVFGTAPRCRHIPAISAAEIILGPLPFSQGRHG